VIEPLRQPDRRQLVARAAEGLGVAREFQRNGDVLQRRHGRDEVERLKDNSDMAAAKACERVLAKPAEVGAGDHDRAGVGLLEPRHHHQQRRFARARRADQANRLAAPYIQLDVLEDMNPGRGVAKRKIDAGERDGRTYRC
jgi:hypothetical protein